MTTTTAPDALAPAPVWDDHAAVGAAIWADMTGCDIASEAARQFGAIYATKAAGR